MLSRICVLCGYVCASVCMCFVCCICMYMCVQISNTDQKSLMFACLEMLLSTRNQLHSAIHSSASSAVSSDISVGRIAAASFALLTAGDRLDVRDELGSWYVGTVLQVRDNRIQVHYMGWVRAESCAH